MKLLRIKALIITTLFYYTFSSSQPIPVELMLGYKYGTVNLAFGRSFKETPRIGFFHMNTVEFNYTDVNRNSFILQDLLYAEVVRNFRLTGGVAYSKGGFDPTAGFQYLFNGEKLLFLLAPRINIESDPSYDIMTILQFKQPINGRYKLYTKLQMLNLFDSGGNIRSYQWLRLGLDINGNQFGVAANFDEYGPEPDAEFNFGLFVRKEIF